MKAFFLTILLMTGALSLAQNIFEHEQEIPNKDRFNWADISFKVLDKKDSITISGTLVSPKTPSDIVIIIVPGSGADTRNSHFILTESLLESGIAVFRYDERGIGQSGGRYNKANYTISMMSEELNSCIRTLRKNELLSGKKLGLLGHSQGGMVTMQSYDSGLAIDFMVQWATPVAKHAAFIPYQIQNGQNRMDEDLKFDTVERKLEIVTALHQVVMENKNLDNVKLGKKLDKASKAMGYTKANYTRFPYLTLASEKDLVRKDFEETYRNVSIPVLYIIGTKDTFVDPVSETALLASFGNEQITLRKMEGLNHYLTAAALTLKNLYEMDDTASATIINWIKNL